MISKSAYIVHTQVISLSKSPFLDKAEIRPAFRNIFSNEQCFSESLEYYKKTNFEHDWSGRFIFKKKPNFPFIKNLGAIAYNPLNPLSIRFEEEIGVQKVYQGLKIARAFLGELKLDEEEIFGYDSTLEDQRMNHLYFELLNPIFVSAYDNDKFQADGKIFLHLYPSGFAILHLAVTIKNAKHFTDLEALHKAITETKPWRSGGHWRWTSRVGNGRLIDIFKLISENIHHSVFIENSKPINSSKWSTSLKIIGNIDEDVANKKFHNGNAQVFRLKDNLALSDSKEYFLISNQGLTNILSSQRKPQSATKFFWKLMSLYEFVILKNQIYEDYAEFFRYEIISLKGFRLSVMRKLTKEDTKRLSVYDSKIHIYLYTLDKHIRKVKPFYGKIYSVLSSGTGFDIRREKVKNLLTEWEHEVELWEHGAVLVWKKAITPIRTFFGLG